MKKKLFIIGLLAMSSVAYADMYVGHKDMGSGSPGTTASEHAIPVYDGIYHAPQYLPGFPTAATIWPRIIEVDCAAAGNNLECTGYNWLPEYGRAEYLMIKPRMVKPPQVVEKVILKEVPVKKKKE